jgi:DNA-binding NarL/FixJ family response regulator
MTPVRTLIVDDHADVRFLIRAIVADAGADVEIVGEADGVEAALDQIERLRPDAVVLDARMPRMDGFEAAPLLHARRPGMALVLCTGLVDDRVRRRAEEAGFAAVVSKDDFDALPAIVERAVRGA